MTQRVELLAGQRQSGESHRAILACNDWLRMGPGRSIAALSRQYCEMPKNTPPTHSLETLGAWSKKYDWKDRSDEYDARLEAEKNARAQEAMDTGLALPYERVLKLKRLGEFLEGELYEQGEDGVFHNVWLPDVKQIGSGEFAERVDIERFNAGLINEFRATLDDLAKETGGRTQHHDITSAGKKLETGSGDEFNRALSTLANAIGAALSRADAKPESTVDAPERPTVASDSVEGG